MPSHPIDFLYQRDFFSTPEMGAVFAEEKRFTRWLAIEAALAAAQGELKIIPEEAAREIGGRARLEEIDLARVAAGYEKSRNSVLPLVNELKRVCGGAGEYVHFGITTQDLLDTGSILEIKEALAIIERDLDKLKGLLVDLSERHLDTPMVGRSHGQVALPITFGFKTANWLAEICRDLKRLEEIKPRLLCGQIGGAVGSMAALGEEAFQVARATLDRLGLVWSGAPWHNSRDRMAECASLMAIIAGGCERIANEVFELCRSEVGELAEPAPSGARSSSTMPHKRNPVLSQRVVVLSRQVRGLSQTVVAGMAHQHERDGRCLWSEMLAMPEIFIYTGAALNYNLRIIEGIEVKTERMLANLQENRAAVMSEWLLFRLAGAIGKGQAGEILHQAYGKTGDDMDIITALKEIPEAADILGDDDFAALAAPERHTGLCRKIAEGIIAAGRTIG